VILHCAAVKCAELTNQIAVTDFQTRRFTRILLILRWTADGRKRMKLIVFTDRGMSIDDDMRTNFRARTNFSHADQSPHTDQPQLLYPVRLQDQ